MNKLRQAYKLLASAKEDLALEDLSLAEKVEIGQILWSITNMAQKELEPIKEALREEALTKLERKPGRHILHGDTDTQCTVVVPQPKVQLRQDVDITFLRQHLGKSFSVFFTEHVQPRSNFSKQATEHPKWLSFLVDIVDTVSEKPRVSFQA